MSYSPNNPRFLTVADSMTSNGEANARLILDTTTNIFYTLDDNGNFLPLQNNEWTETEINISSAQILSMGTTPVELLPAPGAGNYYDIEKIFIEYTHNTTAYTTTSTQLYITQSSDFAYFQSPLLSPNNDIIGLGRPSYILDNGTFTSSYRPETNAPIKLWNYDGDNPTLGDGTLKVKIKYKVVDFG